MFKLFKGSEIKYIKIHVTKAPQINKKQLFHVTFIMFWNNFWNTQYTLQEFYFYTRPLKLLIRTQTKL